MLLVLTTVTVALAPSPPIPDRENAYRTHVTAFLTAFLQSKCLRSPLLDGEPDLRHISDCKDAVPTDVTTFPRRRARLASHPRLCIFLPTVKMQLPTSLSSTVQPLRSPKMNAVLPQRRPTSHSNHPVHLRPRRRPSLTTPPIMPFSKVIRKPRKCGRTAGKRGRTAGKGKGTACTGCNGKHTCPEYLICWGKKYGFSPQQIKAAFYKVLGSGIEWHESPPPSKLIVSSDTLPPEFIKYTETLHAGKVDALWHQDRLYNQLKEKALYPFVISLSHVLHHSVPFYKKPWGDLFVGCHIP